MSAFVITCYEHTRIYMGVSQTNDTRTLNSIHALLPTHAASSIYDDPHMTIIVQTIRANEHATLIIFRKCAAGGAKLARLPVLP